MWSLSTLIKLTVVPNSNQKDTTSLPDSVSAAAKTGMLVCMCQRERKLRGKERRGLITIFTSHFTLSKRSVEESAKAQEEQQKNTNKKLEEETKKDLQLTVFSLPDGGKDGVYWI